MKPKSIEISFTPADNQRLANLCGALDENLKQVETAFDVAISRRGEHFSLAGKSDQTKLAAQALRNFYSQSQHHLSLEQIQLGLIEALNPQNAPDSAHPRTEVTANKLSTSPTLLTRRSNLYGRTQRQAQYLQQIQEHDITFAIGPAGTGKTYLAVAAGVSMFLEGKVERLIFTRPALEAGERLGFLPGDMKEKIDPYLRPIYDAMHDMMPWDMMVNKMESGEIEVAPLAFMRGRTLSNAFVILDEAQNTTCTQMKMFLTRMGESSRMVITGDITQTDLPIGIKSGLRDATELLESVDEIKFIRFSKEDVVRHHLVSKIVNAYDSRT